MPRPRPLTLVLALLATAALAACTAGESTAPAPTSTVTPSAEPTPTPTATHFPPAVVGTFPPTPTPEPVQQVRSTVWLIDVESGEVHTLHEDADTQMFGLGPPRFTEDGAAVRMTIDGEPAEFTLDGTRRPAAATTSEAPRCEQLSDDPPRALVDGEEYEVTCGLFSPDGRYMLYQVDAGEVDLPYRVPVWDEWVLDLEAGETRLLQGGLRHCGGCDFRFGPRWSPAGRYVYLAELLDGGRVFLADAEMGQSRAIAEGGRSVHLGHQPDWHPSRPMILRPGRDGSTILEDLATGDVTEMLSMPWPARFSTGGDYVYGPAYGQTVTGVSVRETALLQLPGGGFRSLSGSAPEDYVWIGDRHVVYDAPNDDPSGGIALLEDAEGCRGTAVYWGAGLRSRLCLEAARHPAPSPDHMMLAAPRASGTTGRADGPSLHPDATVWEIVLVSVATGDIEVLAEGAVSTWPPDIEWNEAGTHILVTWPVAYGL